MHLNKHTFLVNISLLTSSISMLMSKNNNSDNKHNFT